MDAYVARQPIFNTRKKIFGYELLFRDATAKFAPDIDGDTATSTVLANTFFNIGIDTLIGGKKSFINFTQNLSRQKGAAAAAQRGDRGRGSGKCGTHPRID